MLAEVAQPIVFFDIAGTDAAVLSSFYSHLFGWEIGPGGTFAVPVTSPLPGAIRDDPPEKRIYIGVDDVTATLAAIEEAGGAVDAPRFEIPGVVVLGLFRDPAHNAIGLVEMLDGKPRVP
jgi:predicted enzyme related to lactoylglutathione lyase